MKNLFSIGFLFLSGLSFSQSSFSVSDKNGVDVTNSTVTVTGSANLFFPNDEPLKWQGLITNQSMATKPVLVKRQVLTVPNGSENQFCWSIQCYSPAANQATDTVDIAAADTDGSFYSYFFPGGSNGIWTIRYVFFDALNPNDSVHVTINFDVSGGNTSVQNQNAFASIPVGPVPANQFVGFQTSALNLQGSESLRIFDLSGKTVLLQPLKKEQAQVHISTSQVKSGLYLWSIQRGNQSLGSGRLIVQH
jgi:hypothetical protein